jgi:hypothetical protein
MPNATARFAIIFFAAATAAACGNVEPATATCDDARAHMEACFPERDARVPDSCDADMAADITAQSCGELEASAGAAAKGDGFCNPFFWWLCTSSGGSDTGGSTDREPARTGGYSFGFGINVCQSELCVEDLFGEIRWGAECGEITLHDADGNVLATDYINDELSWGGVQDTGAGFRNLDLVPGEYYAQLNRRDGTPALDVKGELARIGVTVTDAGSLDLEARDFRILTSEAEAVRACSDVGGGLTSSCDGEPQSKEDASWSWLVKIEGENEAGRYENIKRSRFVFDAGTHRYLFPRVRPGNYTVTFIEIDVWSSWTRDDYRNSKYEDYLELVDRYATGLEFTETVEITEEDVARGEFVNIFHVDLESQVCL